MKNKIRIHVRLMNNVDMQANVFWVRSWIVLFTNGFLQTVKKKYRTRFTRWINKGSKDFFMIIQHHKK